MYISTIQQTSHYNDFKTGRALVLNSPSEVLYCFGHCKVKGQMSGLKIQLDEKKEKKV